MVYTFKELFKVLFSHGYYSSGFVEDLLIEPSVSAQKLMSGRDLFFRSQSGGFLVAAQVDRDGEKGVKAVSVGGGSVSGGIALAFYVRVQGEVFYKVTRVPAQKGMVLYANNLQKPAGGMKTGDWQALPCRSSSWGYDLTNAVQEAGFGFASLLRTLEAGGGVLVSSYCLKRPDGEVMLESGSANILRQIDLDLLGLPEGCYALSVDLGNNQVLPDYHFVYSDSMRWKPALGMYEWFTPSGSVNGRVALDQSYELAFEDVESFWRYYVVPGDRAKVGALSVVCEEVNGVAARFDRGTEAEIPDGRDAICFTSNQKIPLRQLPSGSVGLKQGEGDELVPLPYAAPGYVMEEKLGKVKVFSDVYVYL